MNNNLKNLNGYLDQYIIGIRYDSYNVLYPKLRINNGF